MLEGTVLKLRNIPGTSTEDGFEQIFLKNLLTCPDKCNIISQCDVVRKYLAKSPGMVFFIINY